MTDGRQRSSAETKLVSAHAKSVDASGGAGTVLAVNGGSSSIRFALYDATVPLRRRLAGKVNRVGLSGTTLNVESAAGEARDTLAIDTGDRLSAVGFLLDWLAAQPEFGSIKVVGHRVVHGMAHSEPEPVTPELLDEFAASRPTIRSTCRSRSS